MITDAEKTRIISQVQFENEIRKELAKGEKEEKGPRLWSLIESKLGLLIIGGLITGVLIPFFQFTQESIKWSRQNRYDNLKYRLEMTRNAMKEMTIVNAFVSEAYERVRPLLRMKELNQKTRNSYQSQMIEMQNRRFIQNARFVSYTSYFPEKERKAVDDLFNKYLGSVQAFMTLLDNKVISKESKASIKKEAIDNDFDKSVSFIINDINDNYQKILNNIGNYLERLENESESYQ